ncbi:MlaD family protein [Vibrio metschnikovii]
MHFSDAQGLVAGEHRFAIRDLEVGMVREIKLAPQLDSIYVEADIYPEATQLLSDTTRFWLVKPTASLSGVLGLDRLVSGEYIALHPGGPGQENHPQIYHALDPLHLTWFPMVGYKSPCEPTILAVFLLAHRFVYKKSDW